VRIIFVFEWLKMSTNTYDVNFLRQCSPREVTVCLLTEVECLYTARTVAIAMDMDMDMDIELILSPRSLLICSGMHNIRAQKMAVIKFTNI